MRLRYAFTALFGTASLIFALGLPPTGVGVGTALAQSRGCGGYAGPVCTKTESCVWYLIYKICTTKFTYYPGDGGGGDNPQPKEPE